LINNNNNNNNKTARHHALNDVVARAFAAAGIPVYKEPTGLSRTDGKRPDGMTLIPWWAGKPAVWDVTVVCTGAGSYLNSSARKYVSLIASYVFFPIAVETQGPLSVNELFISTRFCCHAAL